MPGLSDTSHLTPQLAWGKQSTFIRLVPLASASPIDDYWYALVGGGLIRPTWKTMNLQCGLPLGQTRIPAIEANLKE